MNESFGIVGGDRRQAELAQLLVEEGRHVHTYGLCEWRPSGEAALEQVVMADVVVLPLPLCNEDGVLNCKGEKISTLELFRCLRVNQRILAGQVKRQQQEEAKSCGLLLEDYFIREELTVANAAATAEAAIRVAMERLERTLLGMKCLVLGFGRIGKLLSYRLHGLGAGVTAAARKQEDLAWIRAYGWSALETSALSGELSDFAVIFNTIPSLILNESLLSQLPKDCLCVDLASQRGIDPVAAERLGLQTVWARALPGRIVPKTAAAAIRDTIHYILMEERGDPA